MKSCLLDIVKYERYGGKGEVVEWEIGDGKTTGEVGV